MERCGKAQRIRLVSVDGNSRACRRIVPMRLRWVSISRLHFQLSVSLCSALLLHCDEQILWLELAIVAGNIFSFLGRSKDSSSPAPAHHVLFHPPPSCESIYAPYPYLLRRRQFLRFFCRDHAPRRLRDLSVSCPRHMLP